MGIFKSNKRSNTSTDDSQKPVIVGNIYPNLFSFNSTMQLNNSCVQRGIEAIANSFALMKIYEYDVINYIEKKRTYGNIDDLLNIQPNKNINAVNFKKSVIKNAFIYGNTIIKINRTLSNEIISLELLNSNLLTHVYDRNTNKTTYYYSGRNLTDDIDNYIIFWIYDKADSNGTFGISLAEYAADSLQKTSNITKYQNNWFNGGSISGVLSPVTTDRVQNKKKMEDAKNQFLSGSIDGLVVLDTEYTYTKIASDAKSAALYELTTLNISDIARIMNVPLSYLFVDTKIAAKIDEEDRINLMTEAVAPIAEKFENELLRKLYFPSQWNKKTLEFDYESNLKVTKVTQADYLGKLLQSAGLTPNEIRTKINMPLSTDPLADELWTSQNHQPIKYNMNQIKASDKDIYQENNIE